MASSSGLGQKPSSNILEYVKIYGHFVAGRSSLRWPNPTRKVLKKSVSPNQIMINVSLSYQFCTYPLTVKTKGNLIHLEVITLQPFAYKLTRCGPQMRPQPYISKHFPILSLFSPIFPVTLDSMIKKMKIIVTGKCQSKAFLAWTEWNQSCWNGNEAQREN